MDDWCVPNAMQCCCSTEFSFHVSALSDYEFKFVLVGNPGVGKSSILRCFLVRSITEAGQTAPSPTHAPVFRTFYRTNSFLNKKTQRLAWSLCVISPGLSVACSPFSSKKLTCVNLPETLHAQIGQQNFATHGGMYLVVMSI